MSMRWYVARRLLWVVFATWFALSITFGMLALSPNNGELRAAQQAAMTGGNASEAIEDYRKNKGLDDPLHVRYKDFMVGYLTGNWGYSQRLEMPVLQAFAEKYPYSVQYMIPSILLTVIVGYGLGLYSAMNQYTRSDYIATFTAYFGLSIPNFWFAIMGILVMAVWFQDAVVFGIPLQNISVPTFYHTGTPILNDFMGIPYPNPANLQQLFLPILVISTAGFANNMRYSRAQALEYANSEFVKTARAKGASGWRVLTRHVLRVAIVPLMTILVGDFLAIFLGSSLIIETVFQIPGLGLLTYKSVLNNDTPVVLASTLISVFVAIGGNLIQDLMYVALDPRIDYGDR
jgi:peptide/nickel transport system permease protein